MKSLMSYFIFLIYIISAPAFAQDKTIDSLILKLNQTNDDSTKCVILSILAENVPDDNLWPIYNDKVYTISKKYVRSGYSNSTFYYDQLIASANNKGYLFDLNGQVDSSLVYFNECLELSKKINDDKKYADALYNISKAYNLKGNISKALDLINKCLIISEKIKYDDLTARALINFGLILHKQGDLTRALEYYNRAYKIQLNIKQIRGSGYSLTNIAGVYLDRKDYNNALKYFIQSKGIFEQINDDQGYLISLGNIAKIYILNKDYNKAIENCNKIIDHPNISLYKPTLCRAHDMISSIYFKLNQIDRSLQHSLSAMKLANEIGNPELIRNNAEALRKTYKKTGNYKLALYNYELYIMMRDSINNKETRKASIKSQLKYEYEKKAAADSVRVLEEKKIVAVQLKQEKTQRYALYGGLGLVGLFAIFMVNRFRVTNKQKKLIEAQKKIVEHQKHIVDEKQKEILDSINYAKRIQESLLPTETYINRILKNYKF